MFADDTNLFFKYKNFKTLYEHIHIELQKISSWFILNKLSLNIRKTNYIIFTANDKNVDTGNLVIKINDIIIENVEKTKFLGVIINSKLNWNDHIQTCNNKIMWVSFSEHATT